MTSKAPQKPVLAQLPKLRFDSAQAYAHAVCIVCFLFQRFGLPFGGGKIFVSVLIVPLLILGLLFTGRARIRSSTALLFILVVCCFLGSAIGGVASPDPRMRFSLLSIIELLILYSMFMIEPSPGFRAESVLKVFVFYIRLLAVVALLQYALQFVGIRLFSFQQMFPGLSPVLAEDGFHVVANIKYGSSTLRTNGFFLLEPSIFSQMIAVGIVADYFVLSRKMFLPLYAAAILASYSGTGLLSLGVTLVLMGLVSPTQLPRMLGFLVATAVVVGAAALVFPAEFATLAGRVNGDASAQQRYVGQLDLIQTIVNDPRLVFGFGPGAAEGYAGPNSGSTSPALKLVFDYGALGLVMFAIFFVQAIWCVDRPILSMMCLVNFQLGGGGLLFGPWVFIISLICIWTRPAKPLVIAQPRLLRATPRHITLSA